MMIHLSTTRVLICLARERVNRSSSIFTTTKTTNQPSIKNRMWLSHKHPHCIDVECSFTFSPQWQWQWVPMTEIHERTNAHVAAEFRYFHFSIVIWWLLWIALFCAFAFRDLSVIQKKWSFPLRQLSPQIHTLLLPGCYLVHGLLIHIMCFAFVGGSGGGGDDVYSQKMISSTLKLKLQTVYW